MLDKFEKLINRNTDKYWFVVNDTFVNNSIGDDGKISNITIPYDKFDFVLEMINKETMKSDKFYFKNFGYIYTGIPEEKEDGIKVFNANEGKSDGILKHSLMFEVNTPLLKRIEKNTDENAHFIFIADSEGLNNEPFNKLAKCFTSKVVYCTTNEIMDVVMKMLGE